MSFHEIKYPKDGIGHAYIGCTFDETKNRRVMKIIMQTLAVGAMLYAGSAFGQKIKWESGEDVAFLKDQKVIAVEYDYSKITVKGQAEQEYVAQQKADMNKEKAGDGDVFEKEWTEARTAKYQVHFEKEFNKTLKEKNDSTLVKQGAEAKYTIIVIANDMSLGKGKLLVSKPATVTFTLLIVETANKSNVLAKATMEEVEGEVKAPKGSNWIPGGAGTAMAVTANVQNRQFSNRIAECYEKAGGALAKHIRKKLK